MHFWEFVVIFILSKRKRERVRESPLALKLQPARVQTQLPTILYRLFISKYSETWKACANEPDFVKMLRP